MKQGKKVQLPENLIQIRERTATSVASLPDQSRKLDNPVPVGVKISSALQELTQKTQVSQKSK
jgi:nicotinate phosphoribosyltransferase